MWSDAMREYQAAFDRYRQEVEQALNTLLPQEDCPWQKVLEAMNYSLCGGGKRIRAVLLLAFHEACGGSINNALPFACAVEMIHAYSLIHDDLPCMDDDNLRRGKPSCHVRFGEAMALLAGDGLLTHAFAVAADSPHLPSHLVVRGIKELAQSAGAYGMLGGQVIDIRSEDKTIEPALLDTLHLMKTGAMIRSSARIGCITAGAGEDLILRADRYARNIGLAFQIVDDILDVTALPEMLGKPTHSDNKNHKTTYATVYGVERSRELVRELETQGVRAVEGSVLDRPFFHKLAAALTTREF